MSDDTRRSKGKSIAWLSTGLVTGVLVTGGLFLLAVTWLGNEPRVVAFEPPLFEEVTATGIDQIYDGDFTFFVGGGVAVFDCGGDGLPDLYVAGGSRSAGLYENVSAIGGSLGFSRVASPVTDLSHTTGAYPIDIDSDGLIDLAVLRVGENVMLRGLGDCRFERANEMWGLDGGNEWTVGFSAFWDGADAMPTMAFGNYLSEWEGQYECEEHFLFRPDGSSYGAAKTLSPGYCTLSILFSDWDRSGTADLRMANDRHYYTDGQEQLWNMEGPSPEPYSEKQGWQRLKIWGMGIASHDLDGDGLPEVFLTSQGDNKLQSLEVGPQQPTYEDMALAMGATAHRPFVGDTLQPSTAWHAEFDDVNNDGLMDIFVTKGNVEAQIDYAKNDPNNLLLGSTNGRFEETANVAGLLDYSRSRGAAVTDFNLDGLLDLIVVERREPVRMWQNTGRTVSGAVGPGNWLEVDLEQPGPNRDAVGAFVEVVGGDLSITREITIGGGHASGELGWIHFGLGSNESVRMRVIWPDGVPSDWSSIQANRHVVWHRDSGPEVWEPSRE